MLLDEDQRTVHKEGVRLFGRYYTAPEPAGRCGQVVQLLHWPHDERFVETLERATSAVAELDRHLDACGRGPGQHLPAERKKLQ